MRYLEEYLQIFLINARAQIRLTNDDILHLKKIFLVQNLYSISQLSNLRLSTKEHITPTF